MHGVLVHREVVGSFGNKVRNLWTCKRNFRGIFIDIFMLQYFTENNTSLTAWAVYTVHNTCSMKESYLSSSILPLYRQPNSHTFKSGDFRPFLSRLLSKRRRHIMFVWLRQEFKRRKSPCHIVTFYSPESPQKRHESSAATSSGEPSY